MHLEKIQNESWHGSSSSFALVRCQLTHNRKYAWTLDSLPLLNQIEHPQCLDGMDLLFQNIADKGSISTKIGARI